MCVRWLDQEITAITEFQFCLGICLPVPSEGNNRFITDSMIVLDIR